MEWFGLKLWQYPDGDEITFSGPSRTLLILLAVLLVLFVGLAWFFFPQLKEAYHHVRAGMYYRSAQGYLEAKDLAAARIMIQNGLRHQMNRAESWRLYAHILKEENNPDYAAVLASAWNFDQENRDLAKEAISATVHSSNADLRRILPDMVLAKHADDKDILYYSGVIFLQERQFPRAYELLTKAHSLDAADKKINLGIASLEAVSNNPDAVAKAQAKLRAYRSDPDLWLPATQTLAESFSATRPEEAAALWNELIEKDPKNWNARLRHLELLHRVRPSESPQRMDALWKLTTNLTERISLVIKAVALLGAESGLNMLTRFNPEERTHADVLLAEVGIQARQKNWQRVIDITNASVKRKDVNASQLCQFWFWQGRASLEKRDERTANLSFKNSIQELGDNVAVAMRLGNQLAEYGYPAQAAFFIEKAGEIEGPVRPVAIAQLAVLYQRTGNLSQLLGTLERLLPYQPANNSILLGIAKLSLWQNQNVDRALEMAKSVQMKEPNHPEAAALCAWALLANKKIAEALTRFNALPDAVRKDPLYRLRYVDALKQSGQVGQAKSELFQITQDQIAPVDLPYYYKLKSALR